MCLVYDIVFLYTEVAPPHLLHPYPEVVPESASIDVSTHFATFLLHFGLPLPFVKMERFLMAGG